jgi:hypothetical protein
LAGTLGRLFAEPNSNEDKRRGFLFFPAIPVRFHNKKEEEKTLAEVLCMKLL